MEAIALRFEATAIRFEAIALRFEVIALRLEAIALWLEAIVLRLPLASPGGARINVAPAVRGQKISHSDRPKVYATCTGEIPTTG